MVEVGEWAGSPFQHALEGGGRWKGEKRGSG